MHSHHHLACCFSLPANPKTVTITHTITKVVNAHPWITGTEFTWLCIGVGVLVVGAIAIRRSA